MRNVFLASILTAVLAAGCDVNHSADSPNDIVPTRDDKTFTMTVETVPADRITQRCVELGVKYEANGCASFNLDTKHCTIYVVPPRFENDKEWFAVVGHETWHCRFGEWHK